MFPSRSNLPYVNETNHIQCRRVYTKGREVLTGADRDLSWCRRQGKDEGAGYSLAPRLEWWTILELKGLTPTSVAEGHAKLALVTDLLWLCHRDSPEQ